MGDGPPWSGHSPTTRSSLGTPSCSIVSLSSIRRPTSRASEERSRGRHPPQQIGYTRYRAFHVPTTSRLAGLRPCVSETSAIRPPGLVTRANSSIVRDRSPSGSRSSTYEQNRRSNAPSANGSRRASACSTGEPVLSRTRRSMTAERPTGHGEPASPDRPDDRSMLQSGARPQVENTLAGLQVQGLEGSGLGPPL